MSVVRGSCLCGDVAWEVTGGGEFMSHCHCQRCRKAHGSAFATFVMVPADQFHLVRGAAGIVRFASSPEWARSFCGRCGSVVPTADGQQGMVGVPAGALDDDPGVRPIAHIFVASKAPWYEIAGDVRRFDAYPPGIAAPVLPDLPPRADDGAGDGVRGSCLCGAVAYVVTQAPIRCQHCHCSRCRKARAAAHASNFFTPILGVRFTSGEDRLRSYRVPEARFYGQVFCAACGSPMPRLDVERGIAIVPMGSLDVDGGIRPSRHIFVDSKASWFEVPGDLPQFAEMAPTV